MTLRRVEGGPRGHRHRSRYHVDICPPLRCFPHTPLEIGKTTFLTSLFCLEVTRTTFQSTKSKKFYGRGPPDPLFYLILINLTTYQSTPTPNKGIITCAALGLRFRNMALNKLAGVFKHQIPTPDVGPPENEKNPCTNPPANGPGTWTRYLNRGIGSCQTFIVYTV